jgi:hypothetical protein
MRKIICQLSLNPPVYVCTCHGSDGNLGGKILAQLPHGRVALWSSHPPEEQTIRVRIPSGCSDAVVNNVHYLCIEREICIGSS